jgi:hypothetical protein
MIRAIPYTSLWLGIGLWGLITFGVVGATIWELNQNYLFAYHAQAAQAKVMRMFVKVSSGGRGGKSYTPCIDYRYTAGAYTFECVSKVDKSTYASFETGSEMPILYVTDRLNDSRIETPAEINDVRALTVTGIVVSVALLIGGAFSLRFHLRRNRLYRWLLDSGIRTMGQVSAVKYDVFGKTRTRKYYLNFEFRDNMGRSLGGRSWYLPTYLESGWKEGSQIAVHFDPAKPEHFTVDLGK